MSRAWFGDGAYVITLHNAAASFPLPIAGTEGASCAIWRRGDAGPTNVDVTLRASAATTMAGPVGLFGMRDSRPALIGVLNGGADILIPGANTDVSYAVSVGAFAHLAIGSLTSGSPIVPTSSATVTVTARPIFVDERT